MESLADDGLNSFADVVAVMVRAAGAVVGLNRCTRLLLLKTKYQVLV
jgi:hypothetical protein